MLWFSQGEERAQGAQPPACRMLPGGPLGFRLLGMPGGSAEPGHGARIQTDWAQGSQPAVLSSVRTRLLHAVGPSRDPARALHVCRAQLVTPSGPGAQLAVLPDLGSQPVSCTGHGAHCMVPPRQDGKFTASLRG